MNTKVPPPSVPEYYASSVRLRPWWRFIVGLVPRLRAWCRFAYARHCARRRGATIGRDVCMPLKLAKRANKNLTIGDKSSVNTSKISLLAPVRIGSHVLVGGDCEMLVASHNIDSPRWELKTYGIDIGDYVWIANNALILPSCRHIGRGAVVGAGSVVVRDVDEMAVVGGNPASLLRMRGAVHSELVIESLLGGDLMTYIAARKQK